MVPWRSCDSPPNVCGAPLKLPVARSNGLAVVASPVLGSSFARKHNRPTRTSHTVFDDSVCVSWPKVVAGTAAHAASLLFSELLHGDTAAVTALLDRSLHHAHALKCGPRSWRTKVQTDLRAEETTK